MGGARGTKLMQTLFKAMSTPVFGTQSCVICGEHIDMNYSFLNTHVESHLHISVECMVKCAGSPSELFDVHG